MNKINFKTKILNFITFGYVRKKGKKISQENSEIIEISKDIEIDINKLILYLGGLENIGNVSSTITTLKVQFHNRDLINNNMIKNLGAKGIIVSENTITIVFGNWAQELQKQILSRKLKEKNEK